MKEAVAQAISQHGATPTFDFDCVFLVHPTDPADARRMLPWAAFVGDADVLSVFKAVGPLPVGGVSARFPSHPEPLRGVVLTCPILPAQAADAAHTVVGAVLRAFEVAQALAPVVGLGGWLAPLGHLRYFGPVGVKSARYATGAQLTAAVMLETLDRALEALGRTPGDLTVGVVGAAGAVGEALLPLLTTRPWTRWLLVDLPSKAAQVEEVARQFATTAVMASTPQACRDADVLFLAPCTAVGPLGPEHLAPGTIVIAGTPPGSVTPSVRARKDVLVLDAVLTHPAVSVTGPCDLPGPGLLSPNLAQTLIAADLHRHGHVHTEDTAPLIPRLGFGRAAFHGFGQPVARERFDAVRRARAR